MKKCNHNIIMKKLCCECGHNFSDDEFSQLNPNDSLAVVHSVPDLLVTADVAQELGKKDEERLLKHRKLSLIIDLDHTLVHARVLDSPNVDVSYYGENVKIHQISTHNLLMEVAIRPGAEEFLQRISEIYELHIFTLGTREYAREVANLLDPDNRLIHDRIKSRCESTHSKEQEFYKIFPIGSNMVCILDDRKDVWGDFPNIIQVLPFFYFFDSEDVLNSIILDRNFTLSTIKKIQKFYKVESYFEMLSERLIKLSKMFYHCIDCPNSNLEEFDLDSNDDKNVSDGNYSPSSCTDDPFAFIKSCGTTEDMAPIDSCPYPCHLFINEDNKPDVRRILSYSNGGILEGSKIVFSGVIPHDCVIHLCREYQVANYLGAEVCENVTDPNITHVVCSNSRTDKVKYALSNKNIKLVHIDWLYCCYYIGCRVPEKYFPFDGSDFFDSTPSSEEEIKAFAASKRKSNDFDNHLILNQGKKKCTFSLNDFMDDDTLKDALDQCKDDDELDIINQDLNLSNEFKNDEEKDLNSNFSSNDVDIGAEDLEEYARKLESFLD